MPPQIRERFEAFIASGPLQHPLTKKVTSEHLTQMIGFVKEDSGRKHLRELADKGVMLLIVFGALLFVLILVWMLKDAQSPEILRMIVTAICTFLGGLGLGRWTAAK